MTTYAVLIPDDEDAWEAASAEHRAEVYGRHAEFARRLAERGHKVTGGAELTHSRGAKTVRNAPDGSVLVTDGPYAEAVEQLSGFYVIETDDLDDLLQLCALIAVDGKPVEVRETVDNSGGTSG